MIVEIIIKIGSITISLYENIQDKIKNKNYKINKENLDKKVTEELLKNKTNKKKSKYLNLIIVDILITFFISLYNIQIALEFFLVSNLIILFKKNSYKINIKKKQKSILKVLPFALRQLSIELKAGIGLFDAMKIISNSNYGELSKEFKITLNEIQYGVNYNEAFDKLNKRINIKIFTKVIYQIIRTLDNGGNLANTLNIIANENSRNMKIKYKEYSEKLNSIMLLYIFIAVLIPVIVFIMIIAATTVMGSIVNPEIILVLYLFFFPLIILFMIIFINSLEPTL